MKQLNLKKISVAYGQNQVLNKVEMILTENQRLVILGPSGCGKSTLLKVIAGLLEPQSGEVIFDDQVVYSKEQSINVLPEKRNIGFVFQNYALWPHMSVYENIAYPLKARKWKKSKIKEQVLKMLEQVSLSGKEKCFPEQLSGGEKQRVALARALVFNPKLLLLDEPLANIDAALKNQLIALMIEISSRLKIPMVYVTHDQQEAFEVADCIVVMEKGEVVQKGTPREIYMAPKNAFVAEFIGNSTLLKEGSVVKVVKPQDIKVHAKGKCKGCVNRIVYKGNGCHLHVKHKRQDVIISVQSENYKVGENICFDIQKAHVIQNPEK